jgi:prepilin signal peptidase PulO-like enzyme (type II secretory pathway)
MNSPNTAEWFVSPWVLLVIAVVAVAAGRVLTWGVSRLVAPERVDSRLSRSVEVVVVVAGMALWWWEVMLRAQVPTGISTVLAAELATRCAAHAILFLFLAAAAWVDLRHRVIPDAITVPGVLAGLVWNTVFPFTLLPIATLVERSFAPPEVRSDVLSIAGGLAGSGLPGWFSSLSGLAVAALLLAVWWWVGTSPDDGQSSPARVWWMPGSRLLAAISGLGCLVAAWIAGGDHWAGFVTAIVGLAASGGLVWATRTGASWALGREAMGFGDVTLMAMAGTWLGWQACLVACVLAVFIGLVHGVSQLVVRSESELPFGPSLCLGLVTVVVAWRPLWDLASPQFEQPHELAIVAGLVIVLTAVTLWAWARFRGPGGAHEDPVLPR